MSFSPPSRLAAGWPCLQISPHLDSDLFVTKMTSLSPTSLAQEHSREKKILSNLVIIFFLSDRIEDNLGFLLFIHNKQRRSSRTYNIKEK